MKTYNVILTGQQKHIKGNSFENQTELQVNQIIDKYISDGYVRPKFNGDSFELNNDLYIEVKAVRLEKKDNPKIKDLNELKRMCKK